ncbi:MAG: DUF1573 domain-containing protein, partial [Bacteroidota bacterium]
FCNFVTTKPLSRMKKIFSVFVLCLAVSFVFAQTSKIEKAETAKSEMKEAVEGPQMTFEAKTVDYGTIEQGADPYRVFKFKNTGNAPLVILNAKGSCGCTVPNYDREPVAPGDEGEIKVRYDTKRIGKFTKTVTLTTNVGEQKIILTIKGEVKTKPAEKEALPVKEGNPFNNN